MSRRNCSNDRSRLSSVRLGLRLSACACVLLVAPDHASALPEDADQPIEVEADSAELDETRGTATYRGSVELKQGTLAVKAETLTITIEDEKVVSIRAEGRQAHYQQRLGADESLVEAEADVIVYHTQAEQVELIGDAFLTQNDNEFEGERIQYDIRAGRVDATSSESERVRMILQPTSEEP